MIGQPYNPDNCVLLANQTLNANQFNANVPDASNKPPHIFLWDFVENKLYWVNSLTNIIEQELGGGLPDLVYEALLDQYAPKTVKEFDGALIIGEVYAIDGFGGDFSNIAQVISGTINTPGCIFRAIGTTPNSWGLNSLTSQGWPIARVIENTIDPDIYWYRNPATPFGATYKGWFEVISPNNAFTENKTITEQPVTPQMVLNNPAFSTIKGGIVISFSGGTGANNQIYWTPNALTLQTGISDGAFVNLQDDILRRTRVKIVVKQNPF